MKYRKRKTTLLYAVSLLLLLALSACGTVRGEIETEMSSAQEAETEMEQSDPVRIPWPQPESSLPDASLEAAGQESASLGAAEPESAENGSAAPIFRTIVQDNLHAFSADADAEAVPFTLTLISESDNQVSEPDRWFSENRLYLPMINGPLSESARQILEDPSIDYNAWNQRTLNPVFFDDTYIYEWSPEAILAYDRSSGQLIYNIQIASAHWYLMGNGACIKNGILYAASIFNGYAMPDSCYLVAYDIVNDKILWRSEDQTFNSMNFIVKDDVIFCGYGFTAEDDYIYQISALTGKTLSRTPVLKMPDLFVEQDGQLYVHTYSYDYVFRIE